MESYSLDLLNRLVKTLLEEKFIKEIIDELKEKIQESEEPFIWSTIDIELYKHHLPENIKSIWIFVLKRNAPSIAHFHPNSVQYTVVIEGRGKVKVADNWENLKAFDLSSPEKKGAWAIIDKKVPHEFFPQDDDMVVISFHTCLKEELVEIKCESGEFRVYEKR